MTVLLINLEEPISLDINIEKLNCFLPLINHLPVKNRHGIDLMDVLDIYNDFNINEIVTTDKNNNIKKYNVYDIVKTVLLKLNNRMLITINNNQNTDLNIESVDSMNIYLESEPFSNILDMLDSNIDLSYITDSDYFYFDSYGFINRIDIKKTDIKELIDIDSLSSVICHNKSSLSQFIFDINSEY